MEYDFFISYTKIDVDWARWVGWLLEENDYKVIFQDWDFVAGSNFASQMDYAIRNSKKTIVILSKAYLESEYSRAEWLSAFAVDPIGVHSKLIPIRIEDCSVQTGLLKQIVYIDLVGLKNEDVVKQRILERVSGRRLKPTIPPFFPPQNKLSNKEELKKELMTFLVKNKAICVREDKNIKDIFELSRDYYTNIDIRYDIILQSKEIFNVVVKNVREFIDPSVEKTVSTQCLKTNNDIENRFLNDLSIALGLSQNNWQYDMKQIVIVGTSTKQLLDQVMKNITYVGSIIIIFGPDIDEIKNTYKESNKLSILLTPKDLLSLSDSERWFLVNDR